MFQYWTQNLRNWKDLEYILCIHVVREQSCFLL